MPLQWIEPPSTEPSHVGDGYLSGLRKTWMCDIQNVGAAKAYCQNLFRETMPRDSTRENHPIRAFYNWNPFSSDSIVCSTSVTWEKIMTCHLAAFAYLNKTQIDKSEFDAENAKYYAYASACYFLAESHSGADSDIPAHVQDNCLEARAHTNSLLGVMCEAAAHICVAMHSESAQKIDASKCWAHVFHLLHAKKSIARSAGGFDVDSMLTQEYSEILNFALFKACTARAPLLNENGQFMESLIVLYKAKCAVSKLPNRLVSPSEYAKLETTIGDYEHVIRYVLREPLPSEDAEAFDVKMLPLGAGALPRMAVTFP